MPAMKLTLRGDVKAMRSKLRIWARGGNEIEFANEIVEFRIRKRRKERKKKEERPRMRAERRKT